MGRNAFTVLGVTPPAFLGEAVGQAPDLWIPMTMQRQVLPGRSYLTERDTLWLQVVARLRPGVSRQQAEAGINVAFQQILQGMAGSQLTPDERKEFLDQRIQLTEGAKGVSTIRGNFSEPLMLLMAIVGAVLLIACANVANLLLARATARQKEIGIRLALGASGGRLMRQLVTESVFLAAVGGALGCLVAAWGSYLLLVIVSNGDPTIPLDLHPDLRVLAFSATVSVLTGILFGLAPAIGALRSDVHAALKSGARGVTGAPARFFAGKTFVVLQVAVSMVLLVGASLLLRSLHNLMTQNLGYGREHLLLVRVDPVPSGYKGQQVASLYSRLLERVQAIPGVQAVSLSRSGLFTGDSGDPITVEGYTPQREQDKYAAYDQVGPNYFHTLGIPVLRGRDIGPQDTAKSPQVGVINETMARFYFPHTDPIGKHITDEFPTTRSTFEVVGVVADAREHRLRGKQERRFYVPFFHPIGTVDYAMFVVRTAGNPENIVAAIRHETREIDRTLSIVSIRTLDETLKRRLVQDRLIAQLATVFGALALLLTAIGLYGVMAYAVGRRTNEIGIRMALGAASGNVIRMVLGEAARVAGIGLTIGLPAALAATKLISSRLFGLTATDPLTIGGAILVIASVSLLAGYLPARRAARVDPMLALRCE